MRGFLGISWSDRVCLPLYIVLLFVTAAIITCFACSAVNTDRYNLYESRNKDNPAQSSDSVIDYVSGYEAPENVNSKIFESLKEVLVRKLENRFAGEVSARIVAAAPTGNEGRVDDLAFDSNTQRLSWTYVNQGDYDCSGDVGVPDITPVANYYLANPTDGAGDDAYESWIDGDGSNDVGISDITPIANNYLNDIAGYLIVTSDTQTGLYTPIGDPVPLDAGSGMPQEFDVPIPTGAMAYVAVVPYDSNDTQGVRSYSVLTQSSNTKPTIDSITVDASYVISASYSDADGDSVSVVGWEVTSGSGTITALTADGNGATAQFTPPEGESGTSTVMLTVTDGIAGDVSDNVDIDYVEVNPNVHEVGHGKEFATIEDAVAAADPGWTIVVYPQLLNEPYEQVAVMIRKPNLTIEAASILEPIRLSGEGYDYSGVGSVPRAIFQFDPEADGCILDGFELFGAANESGNGAGARINQADNVTIRNCEIRDCEMGIMSNGSGSGNAENQLIDACLIHGNGSPGDGGYSHNLYLGGYSVRLEDSEVYGSVVGHNVKSRAHITEVVNCYIHDSANREFDLVDDVTYTAMTESNALIQGCTIVKALSMDGNRGVIHFGQDGGNAHNGTLRIVDTEITTTYISAVVTLSASGAGASIENSTILGGGVYQTGKTLFAVNNGALLSNVSGFGLSVVEGYDGVTVDGVAGTNITPPVTILPWE